jgi:transposase
VVSLMIGIDPQKFSVTRLAINAIEELLGGLRVRVSASQAERLLGWATARPERIWGIEGADGMGHLPARQFLAAG